MTISAQIVADSGAGHGGRITTFLLTYPRYIHAELMTHREFSRNASSSRAIPFKRLRAAMLEWAKGYNPTYYSNQPGMQGGEALPGWKQIAIRSLWRLYALSGAILGTMANALGAHKQHTNRFIEQTGTITVVVTATNFSNFFALRIHKDAQPEIKILAELMFKEYCRNWPTVLKPGHWHLPFVTMAEMRMHFEEFDSDLWPWEFPLWLPLIKRSVARCARTSYMNHDKSRPSIAKDEELHDKLVMQIPKHASPAEHQATPTYTSFEKSGNFSGFRQYRKIIPDEYISNFKGPV